MTTDHTIEEGSDKVDKVEIKIDQDAISASGPENVSELLIASPPPQYEPPRPVYGDTPKESLSTVPFSAISSHVDSKYTIQGRFGFDVDDSVDLSELRSPSLHVDRAFPGIGTNPAKKLTTDDHVNTGNLLLF